MRKFLVVLDDSKECLNAMRFAAMRAAHTGGGVVILSVIPPDEFNHWIGVSDIMRAEARERIEAHYEVFAKWMRDKQGVDPELVIREGEPVDEILKQVREELGRRLVAKVYGEDGQPSKFWLVFAKRKVRCRHPAPLSERVDLRVLFLRGKQGVTRGRCSPGSRPRPCARTR